MTPETINTVLPLLVGQLAAIIVAAASLVRAWKNGRGIDLNNRAIHSVDEHTIRRLQNLEAYDQQAENRLSRIELMIIRIRQRLDDLPCRQSNTTPEQRAADLEYDTTNESDTPDRRQDA